PRSPALHPPFPYTTLFRSLAHTHVPTVWSKQGMELERLEWNRRADGVLDIQRKLPNGVVFGAKIVPTTQAVRMELWLTNGTRERDRKSTRLNCHVSISYAV